MRTRGPSAEILTRAIFIGGVALLPVGRPLAQAVAEQRGPKGRGHHTVFYDDARQRVMVTGGATVDKNRNYELLNDLWSFDGSAWTPLPSSGERVSGMRIDADAQKRLYSFGGFTGSAIGDVRVLENDQWRRVGAHPNALVAESGFAFDAARNRFVVFGGASTEGRMLGDVWEYDGTNWKKSTATPPPGRFMHAMVYDGRRKRTVVFGGMGTRVGEPPAPIFADTWEFDGSTWTQMRVAGPPARMGAGAAYDSRRGLMLIFGGSNHDGVLNDLWSWDGASWKKLAENGPEPRVMGYIAYDKKRDRVVLFGGRRGSPDNGDLNDTWEWDGAAWRRVGT